ncbi:hypothetical protein [Streptomyces sp. DSM 118878]
MPGHEKKADGTVPSGSHGDHQNTVAALSTAAMAAAVPHASRKWRLKTLLRLMLQLYSPLSCRSFARRSGQ